MGLNCDFVKKSEDLLRKYYKFSHYINFSNKMTFSQL